MNNVFHIAGVELEPKAKRGYTAIGSLVFVLFLGLFMSGCVAPIGVQRVTTRQAYNQVDANALRNTKPSASTLTLLHHLDLAELAMKNPEAAVRTLHEKALLTGDRDLLFCLSELSYLAARQVERSVKPWDTRDPRDYYLGSAVYAWLFLFGDGETPPPGAFDRRYRAACDFYNHSLGLALTDKKSTNGIVKLQDGRRRLPVGEIHIQINHVDERSLSAGFDRILLADSFVVKGLSTRNREPGLGTPVICVKPETSRWTYRSSTPASILLQCPSSLAALATTNGTASLGLFSPFETTSVKIGSTVVPIESDLTAHLAYNLSDSRVWKLGRLHFLAPAEHIPSQLLQNQPYNPERIPLVLVHGTFSSPLTWAEMANTILSDPVLRRRYQIWTFIYGSGNPLPRSIGDFRGALQSEIARLDPEGTNQLLRQMVIIGHSQGGLLTKSTAVHTGDKLWNIISTNRLEDLRVSEADRTRIRESLYLEPLPFVKRVVFIATPHRGSYLSGSFARRLAQRVVNLPSALRSRSRDVLQLTSGSEQGKFISGRMPTSLDGMSPRNPALLAMAKVPIDDNVRAHSIIPVKSEKDLEKARDGVVAYESAHLENVDSECVVVCGHSCLNQPATIREVQRILHLHLQEGAQPAK